jgi:tripartite-type tricarboxylate transporter receptor subunit TctC
VKFQALYLLSSAVLAFSAAAGAADYPQKPVTLVVAYAPGGTGDVVARLIAEKLAQPQVRERLLNEGADVTPMSADQFGAFVKSEIAKYEQIIRRTGIKAE